MPKLLLRKPKKPAPQQAVLTLATPPLNVVSDCLNVAHVSLDRVNRAKRDFRVHVSNVLKSDGPWAFCPREQVLTFHGTRFHKGSKLTPARKLLFATGHWQHDYIIKEFMKSSPTGKRSTPGGRARKTTGAAIRAYMPTPSI